MEWPSALYGAIEEGMRDDALAVCVRHRGAHIYYLGGCQALPRQRAPFSSPLQRCREDPSCRLAAGLHVHAPPTRIEIDVESLAEAIIRASRAAREERRPEQYPMPASVPPRRPESPPPDQAIPTVTVWSPDGDDGRGE